MSLIGRILSWPPRWRRSRGYGVHSPFAFNLIMETIGERGEYYAYEELRKLGNFRRNSLIFRLICRFQPSTVTIIGQDSDIESVVRMADSRLADGISRGNLFPVTPIDELLCVGAPIYIVADPEKETLADIPEESVIVVCRPATAAGRALLDRFNSLPHGYTFTTRTLTFSCHFSRFPSHEYKLI